MAKKKKDKKVQITNKNKNKNKNNIHITINSNNKRKVSPRQSQPSHNSSIFVSTPHQLYLPQDQSIHHLYPILENLKDKIDHINNVKHDEVYSSISSKPFDVNDSILDYGMKETQRELAKKLDKVSGHSLNYTRTSPYSSINSHQNSLQSSVSGYSSDTDSMLSGNTPIARRTRQQKSVFSEHSHVPKYAPGSKKYNEYQANKTHRQAERTDSLWDSLGKKYPL